MQDKFSGIAVLLIVALTMSSCSLISGIFKAGMGIGILMVIIIVLIIVFIISKIVGKKE